MSLRNKALFGGWMVYKRDKVIEGKNLPWRFDIERIKSSR